MSKLITALVAVLSFTLIAPSETWAAAMCFNASQADLGLTTTCTRETGINADDHAITKVRCTNTGTDNYLVWNATVPYDMGAVPTITGIKLDWQNGTSTNSPANACWSVGAFATNTGQDLEVTHISTDFQISLTPAAYPSTTTTQTSTSAGFIIDDVDLVDCDSNCLGRPLRIALWRNNAACTTNADGAVDVIKICLEY